MGLSYASTCMSTKSTLSLNNHAKKCKLCRNIKDLQMMNACMVKSLGKQMHLVMNTQ
jgi:hypothetical protein